MTAADLIRLARDPSLTPDAFRLLVYVASLGDGEHEIPSDVLEMLLRCRGEKPIYKARAVAERHGLTWKQGGRGHANVYGYLAPGADPSDTSPPRAGKQIDTSPQEPTQTGYLAPGADPSVPVVVGVVKAVEAVGVAREETFPLSEKAESVLETNDEAFAGFRGALRDYLQARVPTARQYGYLQTLVTWLAGRDPSAFMQSDGCRLADDKIPGILATAFNELLATDETKMARPIGDPGNLKTKLGILCRPHRPQNGNGSHPKNHDPWALTASDFPPEQP